VKVILLREWHGLKIILRYKKPFKVVRHIEMPKAAPKKSICHLQKTRDDIELK